MALHVFLCDFFLVFSLMFCIKFCKNKNKEKITKINKKPERNHNEIKRKNIYVFNEHMLVLFE